MTFLFRFVHMYVCTEVTYKWQHFLLCESHEAYEGNGYLTITSSYIHMYLYYTLILFSGCWPVL
jgi:hypothetical protein